MDFEQALARAEIGVRGATERGTQEACEALLSDSRDVIPYDQGDLSNSGQVTVQGSGAEANGVVSYDTPYAVIQHEDTTLRHDGNGQPNYLGGPMRANADRYLGHIAKTVGDALG